MRLCKRTGSIFSVSYTDADALLVFVPAGLTALRVDYKAFVSTLDCVFTSEKGVKAYRDNKTGQLIVAYENPKNIIPDMDEATNIISEVLSAAARFQVKKIAMIGLRFHGNHSSSYYMERELIRLVSMWCDSNPNEIESVMFVDKRGGFSFVGEEG